MKLALCLLITSVALVQASIFGSKPDLEAKATWGETNPFAQVTNGIQNKLFVTLTNHAKKDLTVRYVSGSFHERTAKGAERLVKNSTTSKYNVVIPPSKTSVLTYAFYSEFKPRELLFNAWVDYADPEGVQYREPVYEGQVTVIERKGSWFDPALLFAYLLMLAIVGGAGYFAFQLYTGSQGSKSNRKRAPAPVTPIVDVDEAEAAKARRDEWLPAHHKGSATKRVPKATALSGDETSGAEGYSSRETRRRSGRLNKK